MSVHVQRIIKCACGCGGYTKQWHQSDVTGRWKCRTTIKGHTTKGKHKSSTKIRTTKAGRFFSTDELDQIKAWYLGGVVTELIAARLNATNSGIQYTVKVGLGLPKVKAVITLKVLRALNDHVNNGTAFEAVSNRYKLDITFLKEWYTFYANKQTAFESQVSTITCRKCNNVKSSTEFGSASNRPFIKATICKHCTLAASRKSRYNINDEDYARLTEQQQDQCAICHTALSKCVKICVDHCHKTNVVRGLLCTNCNAGIGLFKDDPTRLESAIKYLVGVNTCQQ